MEDDLCVKDGCYAIVLTRGIATVHDSKGQRFHVRSDQATSSTFCAMNFIGDGSALYEQPSSSPTTYFPTVAPTRTFAPSTAAEMGLLLSARRCGSDGGDTSGGDDHSGWDPLHGRSGEWPGDESPARMLHT